MIPQATIEQIAAANDIVDVIGGYFPLKRAGGMWRALCPFHREKSPSFSVNPQRQIFKCFGCGAGGSVFKFVQQYESVDFPTAVKRLADRAGIRIVEEALSPEDDKRLRMRRRLLALHAEAAEWFHRQLMKSADAEAARAYLKKRGINSETAVAWKIGYAPESWDALGNWAHERGYSREELIESGLVKIAESGFARPSSGPLDSPPPPRRNAESEENAQEAGDENLSAIRNPQSAIRFYDRFRDRVMFPVCNDLGEVIAFSGRVLQADAKAAKYVNSPETMLFTKGNVLFGLHKSKRALIEKESAIVCEGQLDLITAFESGVQNVTAPQGTAFTDRQARMLKRYANEVVLCFDADAAGQKAAERSLAALLEADLHVRVAEMPDGHDPDSLIRERGADAFRAVIDGAKDFFDFQIDAQSRKPEFATPRGKMQFAAKMAAFVGLLTNAVLRENIINKICSRLDISPNDFRPMLARAKFPSRADSDEPAPQTERATVELSTTMRLLCLFALRDTEARAWLLEQPQDGLVPDDPGAELLAKILKADLRSDDPHSVNAFADSLDEAGQSAISSLLADRLPSNGKAIVRDCWIDLRRCEIRHRQEVIANRLRQPNLPMSEVEKLQKEVLDLHNQRQDIARLFPPSR